MKQIMTNFTEYIERYIKWKKLEEQINNMKTTNKKPKGARK